MKSTNIPFFTIITATYNASRTLHRLLESLAEQNCQDFVWICQDGASTDETMDIVKLWSDKISISAESCKDAGVYDAWNKALAREESALGEWVIFLGADDLLVDKQTLQKAKEICQKLPSEVLFAAGNLHRFNKEKTISQSFIVNVPYAFENLYAVMMPHTSLFSRKETFQQKFDASFKICGDHDWLLKVWLKEKQMISLNFFVSSMELGGISNNKEFQKKYYKERKKMVWKYKYKVSSSKKVQIMAYIQWIVYPRIIKMREYFEKTSCGKAVWPFLRKMKYSLYIPK